jgi:tetratricopeptide (TPR) repeat protein
MSKKIINILNRNCIVEYEKKFNYYHSNCVEKHSSYELKKKVNVALNMIVKNEDDNIIKTLESVKEFCDLFIILDTGSEDNTVKNIINYCEKIKKTLYLISCPFENFSITRNIAIEYADNKADYLLFMDSNDELKNYDQALKTLIQDNYNNERMLGFYIKQEWNTNGKIDRYVNIRLVKTKQNWNYKTPVHEYITCPKVEKNGTFAHVSRIENGPYIYQDRSKDAHKSTKRFKRDKELLYNEYLNNPNDGRTLFYLGQTCSCLGEYEEAYKYYIFRTKEKGFMEEVFHAYLRSAEIAQKILNHSTEEIAYLYTKALECSCLMFNCPRSEPLIYLADMYIKSNNKLMSHFYIKQACESVYPTDSSLFVDGYVYDYTRWHMLGITGYYVNDFNLGLIGSIFAYLNGKKEIDKSNIKTYIDSTKHDSNKLIEFLDTQTFQNMLNLFVVKKTNKNLQNHFLIQNIPSFLDKFKL